jgi:hypothetical protein
MALYWPMTGIYGSRTEHDENTDQYTFVMQGLSGWSRSTDSVIIYANPADIRSGIFSAIGGHVRQHCPLLKVIGGIRLASGRVDALYDMVFGEPLAWESWYSKERWKEIAELTSIIMRSTKQRLVALVHEPANYPVYQLNKAPNWADMRKAYEQVHETGAVILFDVPVLAPDSSPHAVTARRWIDAIGRTKLSWRVEMGLADHWLIGEYFGWTTPPESDWRAEASVQHRGMVGDSHYHHRLFVTTNGHWGNRRCRSPQDAYQFCRNLNDGTQTPVLYVNQSDWHTVARSLAEMVERVASTNV